MGAIELAAEHPIEDYFHHIDMGFLNRRLCMTALMEEGRALYAQYAVRSDDHASRLSNDHLLVTMLIDFCESNGVPTLLDAISQQRPRHMFMSTHRLAACPAVYEALRVEQEVLTGVELGRPVCLAYHTEHIVSSTGRMALADGAERGHVESIIGLVHDRDGRWEVEPLVMGAPWFDHPRNGPDGIDLMWMGSGFGEILAEDVDQFARLTEVEVADASEWMDVMRELPEAKVKIGFAKLLAEPTKSDWGGERNDLFTGQLSLRGRRRTAAFLLKGPAKFKEMTLDMCGARADQILRLAQSQAEISIVQHSHQIGEAVRETLRMHIVAPGRARKFCVIDGLTTYRIFKAYNLLD